MSIETLLKVEQEYGTRFERMQQRPALRARRRAYIQLDRKINAACERLAQHRISIKEFLLYTGHLAYDAGTYERNKNIVIVSEFQLNVHKNHAIFTLKNCIS